MIAFTYSEYLKIDKIAVEEYRKVLANYPKCDLANDADWMIRNILSGGALMPKFDDSAFVADSVARADSLKKAGVKDTAKAKPAANMSKGRAVLTYSPDYSTAEYLGQVIPLEPTQRMVCRVFHTAYKAERKPVTLSFGIIQERAEQMRKPGETPGQIKTLGRLFHGHPFWESVISRVVGVSGKVSKDIYRYDPTASPQAVEPAKPRKIPPSRPRGLRFAWAASQASPRASTGSR